LAALATRWFTTHLHARSSEPRSRQQWADLRQRARIQHVSCSEPAAPRLADAAHRIGQVASRMGIAGDANEHAMMS
jgi:hypothetical protein